MRGTAHITFGMDNNSIGMPDGISHRLGTDDNIVTIEQHGGRGREFTILVWNRNRLAMLIQVGDAGISRSQVDADGVCRKHDVAALLFKGKFVAVFQQFTKRSNRGGRYWFKNR